MSSNQIHLWAEIHGIIPKFREQNTNRDELNDSELLKNVTFVSKTEGIEILPNNEIGWSNDFSGTILVETLFDNNPFFEPASDILSITVDNGKIVDPSDSGNVTIKIKDLDGWQIPRNPERGSEIPISAAQGFGKQRKFKHWLEVSEDNQTLRMARRVSNPSSISTTLFAENNTTLFARYDFSFVGTVVNGYLKGTRVFLDIDGDREWDEGEPFAISDERGQFEIDVEEEEGYIIDENGNKLIDASEAMIVAEGGLDIASSVPMETSLRAPPSYRVVNTISTVVSDLIASGIGQEQAEGMVLSVLELPDNLDVGNFEPLAAVLTDGEKSRQTVLRSTQLANLFNEGSRYLELTTGHGVDRIRGGELVVQSLSEHLLEVEARPGAQSIDLVSENTLLSIINDAAEQARLESIQFVPDPGLDWGGSNAGMLSARGQLFVEQQDIAQIGDPLLLDSLVKQISIANGNLEDLAREPDVHPTGFKTLASVSQSTLNDLGMQAANTLFEEEVAALQALQGTDADSGQAILSVARDIKTTDDLGLNQQNELLEVFSLPVLQEVSDVANTNIFAPVLGVSRITAPADIHADLVVGTFAAFDPEGTPGDLLLP